MTKPLNNVWILCLSAVVFAAAGCSKNDGGSADTTSAPMSTPSPAPDTAPAPAEPAPAPAPETAPPSETTPPAETPPKP